MNDLALKTRELIERVHASETMAVIVTAGAGSQALHDLMAVPGASRTVLEMLMPYGRSSLSDFLGYEPETTVGPDVAGDMAHRAYRRALRLRGDGSPVVGVGCTAAIVTDRIKRGTHRCHVEVWSSNGKTSYSLEMVKGLRDRAGEESTVSGLILRALVSGMLGESAVQVPLEDRECIDVRSVCYDDPIKALLADHVESVRVDLDGTMTADLPVAGGVLAGSFDPFHSGHEAMVSTAARLLNSDITLELSVTNVDKASLAEAEIRRRLDQFTGRWEVVIDRAPAFNEKARLFPGCTFVVGWDTAVRLVDPRYYRDDEFEMLRALDEIRELDCEFLVAGRCDGDVFRTLDDVQVPSGFGSLFTAIQGSEFRCDLSSTELRMESGASKRP